MVLPLWEGSGENKEVLETRRRGFFSGLFFWADFVQICLLARGGCAWHEAVEGGRVGGWILEIPTVEILTWPPIFPPHRRRE